MNLLEFKNNYYQEFYKEIDKIPCNPMEDNGDAYYGYITKPYVEFDVIFENIKLPENPKCVDIGAGFCENLLRLGAAVGSNDLYAVEINKEYTNKTKPLIKKYKLPIKYYNENYEDHDISKYDVIHSFHIAKRQPEYGKFNDWVLKKMKIGAVWIEILPSESNPENPNNKDSVYRAIERSKRKFKILYNKDVVVLKRIS